MTLDAPDRGVPRLLRGRPPTREVDLTGSVAWPPVPLTDLTAREQQLAGAKAARLADALGHGLPVVGGWVLPVPFVSALIARPGDAQLAAALREVWDDAAAHAPLVVRSSAPGEDGVLSSNAGRFTSVLGVASVEHFLAAVAEVAASGEGEPMAVLVQQELRPRVSGVLFGVHPVTGDPRPLLALVEGSPAPLVSGEVTGDLLVLGRRGVRRDGSGERASALHGVVLAPLARRLRALGRQCAAMFGGPQDIEWALDDAGRLWLLQSRPVTRTAAPVERTAPLLGPGPVAETLPLPLWPLEAELWVPPLDAGLTAALRAAGAPVPADGVVRVVESRAVADLGALGAALPRRRATLRRLIDPRPALHRTAVAWRVARLRVAWPVVAADLLAHLDGLLSEVPPLRTLDEEHLLGLLDTTGQALVSAHGYEALAGLVLDAETAPAVTAASVALDRLAAGETDPATTPVLLSLLPPAIEPSPLPPPPSRRPVRPVDRAAAAENDPAVLREGLRLRARWLQELQASTVRELGSRLTRAGRLADPLDVRTLTRAELAALVVGELAVSGSRRPSSVVLPERFRLDVDGGGVAEVAAGGTGDGTPAGGGRATGVVVHRGDVLPADGAAILVVDVLDPGLAVALPHVAGLVAATGSPLSHLAILAREYDVATVVGVPDAVSRFAVGTTLTVDGRTGEVTSS